MARETAWYESALSELADYTEHQAFAGAAGFYAWGRLEALVTRLRHLYDAYELEGDVAPVQQEMEAYLDDLAAHQVRPDSWVTQHLNRFVNGLQSGRGELTIETRQHNSEVKWPERMLAVSPEKLQALHDAQGISVSSEGH